MLILERKAHQTLVIGDDIKVTIVSVTGGRVRVGVDAPTTTKILREEVTDRDLPEPTTPAAGAARS